MDRYIPNIAQKELSQYRVIGIAVIIISNLREEYVFIFSYERWENRYRRVFREAAIRNLLFKKAVLKSLAIFTGKHLC